ncbi:queuosine salvage protein [Solenopsis invicta]|uniref:queuosine salvage protein n=1 Tax=Solenopsis invicta TaxID=13686 RepID=UPI000595F836|nr:queuosine salvage protein [Solenopsis invicta]
MQSNRQRDTEQPDDQRYIKRRNNTEQKDPILYVAENAQNVSINMNGVTNIVLETLHYMRRNYDNHNLDAVTYNYVRLSTEFHPKVNDPTAADWLFVLNTLNYSLWTPKGQQEWKVDGLTGYLALCAALKRAVDDGLPIWDSAFYKNISINNMKHIFRGDNNTFIPRIFSKLRTLHRVGEVLVDKYKGTFKQCILSCNRNPMILGAILRDHFPSFYDMHTYDDETVPLNNKAWILVTDIWAFFPEEHELAINIEIKKIPTIFVDYRVPQILHHFNALVYSKNLLDKLEKSDKPLVHGSREELEIRCCSLIILKYAHKLMMDKYSDQYTVYLPELELSNFDGMCLFDNFLWDYRQLFDEQLKKNPLFKIDTDQY